LLICKSTFLFLKNTFATPDLAKEGVYHQLLLVSLGEEWPTEVPASRPPVGFLLHQSRTGRLHWPPGAGSFRKVENLETPNGFMRLDTSRG